MKLKEVENNWYPEDMDERCIELCTTLNRLPGVKTTESCEGHGEHPYWIFFRCTNLESLSRLGRVVERNYSDGNFEIVVSSCDSDPYGCFWLRTKTILDSEQLDESIKHLIDSIYYWFSDEFDQYFSENKN